MKTLLSHRSIRKYQNRPIEKEILDEILKAVQAAPNWVNLQHISVIVVQEQQRRKKFAELCGGQKNFENGDITYCEAHHNMAIFYAQTDDPILSVDVIPIGRVTSDLSVFNNLDNEEEVIFSLVE